MTSELRKAAERLLEHGMGAIDRPPWVAKATMDLARAYLAANLADDDEPINAAFLGMSGFYFVGVRLADIAIDEQTGYALWLRIDLVLWEAQICHGKPNHESDGIALTKSVIKTRGQLRRLAAALGVTLKGDQ